MSDEMTTGAGGQLKPLAVRMKDELRAQLDILAQINKRTTTEEIRVALEDWVDRAKADPTVQEKAQTIRDEIEREAQSRRNAIASIFDTTEEPAKPSSSARGVRRGKTAELSL